jgi:hypothetical protein
MTTPSGTALYSAIFVSKVILRHSNRSTTQRLGEVDFRVICKTSKKNLKNYFYNKDIIQ